MQEVLNNLIKSMKEFVYKVMESIKECFRRVVRWFEELLNSIDYKKYIKYKKYQKRVKNRKILYAKIKTKYGR